VNLVLYTLGEFVILVNTSTDCVKRTVVFFRYLTSLQTATRNTVSVGDFSLDCYEIPMLSQTPGILFLLVTSVLIVMRFQCRHKPKVKSCRR